MVYMGNASNVCEMWHVIFKSVITRESYSPDTTTYTVSHYMQHSIVNKHLDLDFRGRDTSLINKQSCTRPHMTGAYGVKNVKYT